jgi:hypothetical protein
MPIDYRRVVLAAVEAALEDPSPSSTPKTKKGRLRGGRAVLIGAGLMTAGRLATGGRGREIVESLQHRLEESLNPRDDEDSDPQDEEYFDADHEEVEDFDEEDGEDLDAQEDEDIEAGEDENTEAGEDEDVQAQEEEEPAPPRKRRRRVRA